MPDDQLLDRRDGLLVPQQALGRHHDQRLAEVAPDLPPQQVEELRRGRGHDDLDVVLGAELEEPLEPGAGVLGPLAFVAVRQEHDQPAASAPLRLGRGDELVDDHLGAVGEVAELGLPHDQHVRLVQRVAVVEAEHGRLGEQAVVDAELGLAVPQVVERDVAPAVVGVDQHGVPVAEGAAAAVLAAEADRGLLPEQRADGQHLGRCPSRAALLGHRLLAGRPGAAPAWG